MGKEKHKKRCVDDKKRGVKQNTNKDSLSCRIDALFEEILAGYRSETRPKKRAFECSECFKVYKGLVWLQKHMNKCPEAVHIVPEKKQNSIGHASTVKKYNSNVQNQGSHSFKCSRCCEQFDHRRGFLHHTKSRCNKDEDQSLDSILNAIYQDVLRRSE